MRYDTQGRPHPVEFGSLEDFLEALKDCLEKMAGPRQDGKLSQLEYVAEKLAALENGVGMGLMSANAVVRQAKKVKVVCFDIVRDLRYARQCVEAMTDGGNEKGELISDGREEVGSGRSLVQVQPPRTGDAQA